MIKFLIRKYLSKFSAKNYGDITAEDFKSMLKETSLRKKTERPKQDIKCHFYKDEDGNNCVYLSSLNVW